MKYTETISLDYDDVTLVSRQISDIGSRDEVNTSVELFPGLVLQTPIIASPMVDVVNSDVAIKLGKLGGFAFLHRFCSIEDQIDEYLTVSNNNIPCGCAIGISDEVRFKHLYDYGCRYFVVDVANGANTNIKTFIESIIAGYGDVDLMVGNVVSDEQFEWCAKLPNVYAVRCAVGAGKACTTKNCTGIYQGMISLLQECTYCNDSAKWPNIVADGGIDSPSKYCKALAFGANVVMLGSALAATLDSPAQTVYNNGQAHKVYKGSASFDNQKLYKTTPKYIEGKTVLLPCEETIEDLVNRFQQGLRSSMSYFDSHTLSEYREKMDWKLIK